MKCLGQCVYISVLNSVRLLDFDLVELRDLHFKRFLRFCLLLCVLLLPKTKSFSQHRFHGFVPHYPAFTQSFPESQLVCLQYFLAKCWVSEASLCLFQEPFIQYLESGWDFACYGLRSLTDFHVDGAASLKSIMVAISLEIVVSIGDNLRWDVGALVYNLGSFSTEMMYKSLFARQHLQLWLIDCL